ncbi:polysaccharide biosynthesis protein [Qipengyuania nanhaisediminis]|uniref:polysaccharide biosynthesis protein n=1 Tax=Qipengyuania nanhaisediminis TaxID=604088 RepID=UPI0038B391BE
MSYSRLSDTAERRVAALLAAALDFASHSMTWPRPVKRLAVMLVDAGLCAVAVWIAFSLRLGALKAIDDAFLLVTGAMLALWYPIALMRGVYRAIFRFSGRGAIVALSVSIMLLSVPLVVVVAVIGIEGVPRTLAVLGPLVFFLAVALSRIVGRYVLVDLFNARNPEASSRRIVLIYGAGATGQRLASALGTEGGMQIAGFVDDDHSKWGHLLDGRKVYRSAQIADLIARRGVTDVVLAMARIGFARRKAIIAALEALPVNVQTVPPMRDLIEGRIGADTLRPIEVEDLLGRGVVPGHDDLLARPVAGKLVMVTGAGGSIGSEICRQIIAQRPAGLVLVEASEFALFTIGRELESALAESGSGESGASVPTIHSRLADVSDKHAVARLMAEFAPDTIFHAAAYKHVPLVEQNVVEAVRNNVRGARLMAEAALAAGSERFVLVSTDKAVRPPNVMGASKRVCEIVLQDLARRADRAAARGKAAQRTIFAMVRFGNVLGSSGSVVPIFRRQIEAGGPVTVTDKRITRYFMTIFEAAQLVIQAGSMARGGEVFLLDMGEPVKIWDLARSMIRLAGLSVRDAANPAGDIAIIETGLRPGEKLYEELLIGERAEETEHPRIMQGHEEYPPTAAIERALTRLDSAIARGDACGCRAALAALVPTLEAAPQASGPLRRLEKGGLATKERANGLPVNSGFAERAEPAAAQTGEASAEPVAAGTALPREQATR